MASNLRDSLPMGAGVRWIFCVLLAAGLMAALAGDFARAQSKPEPKEIGTFARWKAYVLEGAGGKVCYVASQPVKWEASRKNVRRGPIFFFITFRPAEKVKNEVSVAGGYPFNKGSTVSVIIGPTEFLMATEGEGAWIPQRANENKLVTAMKKSITMVIKGVSTRGTRTTDTYSLEGVSAALSELEKNCT